MARTTLTPIQAVRNGSAVLSYTAVAAADDAVATIPEGEKAVLIVVGHATNPAAITIDAGAGSQSWMSAAGAIAVTVAATTTRVIGPFDSAQFEHADGTFTINTDQPVTMAVLRLP